MYCRIKLLIFWQACYLEYNWSIKMKVVYNGILGGWYIVRGAHQTPISGRFDSKEAALAHLRRRNPLHTI